MFRPDPVCVTLALWLFSVRCLYSIIFILCPCKAIGTSLDDAMQQKFCCKPRVENVCEKEGCRILLLLFTSQATPSSSPLATTTRMAEPTSLFLTLSGSSDQVQSVLHAPTRIEDVIRELSLAPDSSESESESDVDNQEDWQDNANTVTGSIRGDTAEPDGDMGQHSTSDEEDQLISGDDEPGADSGDEETTTRLENQSEFMEMEVIDAFQGESRPPILFVGKRPHQLTLMTTNSTVRGQYQSRRHVRHSFSQY